MLNRICKNTCQSVWILTDVNLDGCQSWMTVYSSVWMSVCTLYVCTYVLMSVWLVVSLYGCQFECMSVCMNFTFYGCQYVWKSVPVWMSVCMFVSLYENQSVWMSLCKNVSLYGCQFVWKSVCMKVSLYCMKVSLYECYSVWMSVCMDSSFDNAVSLVVFYDVWKRNETHLKGYFQKKLLYSAAISYIFFLTLFFFCWFGFVYISFRTKENTFFFCLSYIWFFGEWFYVSTEHNINSINVLT